MSENLINQILKNAIKGFVTLFDTDGYGNRARVLTRFSCQLARARGGHDPVLSDDASADMTVRLLQCPAWDSKTNPLCMTATPGARPPEFDFCRSRLPLSERCNCS